MSSVLDDAEREQIRGIVARLGLAGAARELGLSRSVISSVAAGIIVRRGSLELVRDALRRQVQVKR